MDKLRLAWLFPQGRKLGVTLQDSVRTFFQHAVEGEAHTTTTRPMCGAPGTKACAAQQLLSLLELGWGLPDRSSIQMDCKWSETRTICCPSDALSWHKLLCIPTMNCDMCIAIISSMQCYLSAHVRLEGSCIKVYKICGYCILLF